MTDSVGRIDGHADQGAGESDPHDAGIRLGGDKLAEEVERGEAVSNTYGTGTGGLADITGGGSTRGDSSGQIGAQTGGILGGKGVTGTDVGSSDIGASDITGGGTAAGLGGTSGGGTLTE